MGSSEVKVGAFTLVGAIILAGIITFMGAFTFGRHGYELHINYPQVSGLMQGHAVRYAGVQVGTVKKVDVAPDGVEVTAEIEENIQIPQGSVFTIGSDGIMGEKFVSIVPPGKQSEGFIAAGSKLRGVPGGGMEEFFASSGDLMAKVESIADALNNVFGDKEVQQSMRDGFKNARDISDNMNTFTRIMAEAAVANQQDLDLMIKRMSEMSQRMNAVALHMQSIMEGVDNDGATGRNVAQIAEELAKTSARVENIVRVLEMVSTDSVTGEALKDTVVNVRQASEKANRILGTLTGMKIQADVSHSARGTDWRGNLGLSLTPGKNNFVYLGGYDIGGASKFDFIAGRRWGATGVSVGAMQGEFGVGLSFDLGRDFRLYSQRYDIEDAKVRLGGEVRLSANFSLYGETMNLRGSKKDTYVGVRSYF